MDAEAGVASEGSAGLILVCNEMKTGRCGERPERNVWEKEEGVVIEEEQ